MSLTFGSLFAGVGGFDMGMEQAGWTCKFQVEWDKHCQNILNRHWPDIPKWGDVSTVSGTEIPPVDCIIFGSPCQDLSVAGKRAGLEGERSGLFHEAVRIIKEMRDVTNGTFPRWAIWENVAGALSSNNGRDFATVINEMAEAGAVLQEYAVLDAQHFGIPQRRRRVFLVACFDSAIAHNCPNPLLPVSESVRRDSPSRKPKRQAASRTLTEGIGGDGHRMRGFGDYINDDTASAIKARDHKDATDLVVSEGFTSSSFAQYAEGVGTLRSNGGDLGGGSETVVVEPILLDIQRVGDIRIYSEPVQSLQARMGTGGNSTPMLAFDTQFGSNAVAYDEYNDSLAETHHSLRTIKISTGVLVDAAGFKPGASANARSIGYEEGLSPSLEAGGGGNNRPAILEPSMAVRRLTPLECERLMGWPDDHTRYNPDGSEQADTHRDKQCGNGVATPVAKWIAQHIAKAEQ